VQPPSVLYLQEPQRWLYEAVPPLPGLPWVDVKLWGRYWWTPQRLRHFAAETIRVQCLRIVARAELDNLRAYDRVLVNSYFSRESLLRSFNVDARVCYLGIDTDLFQALDGPREDLVVGLGAFGRHKNIELAIRTIGALPEPRPTLAWVGNSGELDYIRGLEDLAREQGVRFEIRRLVGDAELVDLMNRATLMLYTSRLEPFGFAPLEANACGLPVVAVAEGGVRETIVDGVNGLLADADPDALAAAVQRLRADPDLARRLGRQGRERVLSAWGLEPSVDRLEAQFRKLLS
jgi:glycosyltransferase involved in cell wall biosynthesis